MDKTSIAVCIVGLMAAAVLSYDAWINQHRIKNQRAACARHMDQVLYNEHHTVALNREARAEFWETQADLATAAGRHDAADTAAELAWVARQP